MNATYNAEPLELAVGLLLGVCDSARSTDGAGFNKFDAVFARDVYDKRGRWTPGQVFAIWKMLRKYRVQLSGMEFDFTAVPEPIDPKSADGMALAGPTSAAAPSGVVIEAQVSGMISVRFPYKPEWVELIRTVPGRQWDGMNKQWLIKPDPLAMEALINFCQQTGGVFPKALDDAYRMGVEARKQAEIEAQAAMADSMAVDADFNVEGLGGVLMPFQRAGVKYASEKKRCLIADEMGLGKTVQGLATIKHLGALPALVLCPASLKRNWQREAIKWLPGHAPLLFEENRFGDISIMNYEQTARWEEYIIEKMRYKALILDEAHYLKNHKAQRSIAVRHIAQAMIKKWGDEAVILGLTGTPVLNLPAELLHLLQVLGRLDDVGGFNTFRERYLYGDFKGNGRNLEELQQICRSRFLIRREKMQVLTDLPPKRRIDVDLKMEDPTAYAAVENAELDDSPAAALVRIGELRREAARQKVKAAVEWVSEFMDTGKKLIYFAVHREIQAELLKAFPKAAQILGDDEMPMRQAAVDRFQEDPDCQLIICSLKAAGVGLTLTAASDVAFHEFGWTPGDMDQAEDRAHRIGQQDSVTCWYLRATGAGIDDTMLALIASKREVGNQLLSATRTEGNDQEAVKNQLVKSVLEQARRRGTLKTK